MQRECRPYLDMAMSRLATIAKSLENQLAPDNARMVTRKVSEHLMCSNSVDVFIVIASPVCAGAEESNTCVKSQAGSSARQHCTTRSGSLGEQQALYKLTPKTNYLCARGAATYSMMKKLNGHAVKRTANPYFRRHPDTKRAAA